MTDALANLLGLYAGLLLMNTIISAFMWWTQRGLLNRDLLVMWAAMLLAFIAQGAASANFEHNAMIVVLSFSTLWFANLSYARLVTRLIGLDVPVRMSVVVIAIALALGFSAYSAGLHFTFIALPVAIGVVFPAVVSAGGALLNHWSSLSITGRAMMVSCLAITVHELDYPFLRHLPEYSAMGFTIAIVVVFALSIFAPAVVLEVVTREQATVAAEMDVARKIQLRVLPGVKELAGVPDLEINGFMRPADEVGGDYYDVCNLGGTSWILVGDVTGHGLGSGLVMLMAQSVIASILHTRGSEITPSELTFLANRVLFRNLVRLGDMRSMTIVALRKDPGSQRYVYSGNHDHVYIYRADSGAVETLEVSQVPHDLGFLDEFPQSEYSERSFELGPRDLLLMATDGVTEAAREGVYSKGMFDPGRVKDLLAAMGTEPLQDIRDRLLGDLEAFTGGVYHDDVTFLLARPTQALS
ncbi:MAG: SpoIIE family protein phosphatase [Myxococcota bacterium]